MTLSDQIKSKYKNVTVKTIDEESHSVEVVFSHNDASVIVTNDQETNRFSASYPKLIRDGRGGWTTEEAFSENMLIEGMFGILSQVKKHGKVKPEIID